ncbi:MAG TPA: TlyA family RNA methyltransferase [Vicinamibacterales bacterium]|nr:TlyA family RNA methyltransferase [Vicinamibacterales bacterium]
MGARSHRLTPPSTGGTSRRRLDLALVDRGLAASRERARALVLAGRVRVNDRPATKAGMLVGPDDRLALTAPDHPYVGRGALKLAHALDAFGIVVAGRTALDIGASTGGFTEVLLERGAARVVALDVGRGQLAWRLRTDPRVVVLEGLNARHLTPDRLPADLRRFGLVTIDVSFISLRLVLPVVPPLVEPQADVVALVKPQFEAGRHEVGRGGVVRDPGVHARVIEEIAAAADRIGLTRLSVEPSPIAGAEGNVEFFMHLRPAARASHPPA